MRPALDLTRTIVVLTHSRTGSSLLMQTLRLLGKEVLGEARRRGLPPDANPRGFYEYGPVLADGLEASVLADNPALLRDRAVKVALAPMVERALDREWCALEQHATMLLPIRRPAEALHSRQIFLGRTPSATRRLQAFREALDRYLVDLCFLADRWGTGHLRGAPAVCIDYALAIADPQDYVTRVAMAASLSPSAAQVAAAVDNISSDLYRYRAEPDSEASSFARGLKALESLHDALRGEEPDKWARIRALMPAWVRRPRLSV